MSYSVKERSPHTITNTWTHFPQPTQLFRPCIHWTHFPHPTHLVLRPHIRPQPHTSHTSGSGGAKIQVHTAWQAVSSLQRLAGAGFIARRKGKAGTGYVWKLQERFQCFPPKTVTNDLLVDVLARCDAPLASFVVLAPAPPVLATAREVLAAAQPAVITIL